jgi:isocitrate dehydrogenase kinase/phosphatase
MQNPLSEIMAELREIEAIKQLKARYFRLLDNKRRDELGDVFTEDCQAQYLDDVLSGREAIRSFLVSAMNTRRQGSLPDLAGLYLFAIPDAELRSASVRAYNDWVIETYGHPRFRPSAVITVQDIRRPWRKSSGS